MSFLDFLKKKSSNETEKSSQDMRNGIPEIVQADGKYIHISTVKVIKKSDGAELYLMQINETKNIDDCVLLDSGKPISFELPEGRTDLVGSLLTLWDSQRSNRELGELGYTYIGNIKYASDGKAYYYNEAPSR